ncbi:MAG TPA: glycosyltransferase family 2 protein [Vicinamibacterales bacterium]|nr:glycosyltransferase family 2 protein [Vicinamibacterales bacterium]
MSRSASWPIAIRSVDLSKPLAPIGGLGRYSRVRVFVSQGEDLIGSVDIWHRGAESVSVSRLTDVIAEQFGLVLFQRELHGQLLNRGPAIAPIPSMKVSIVVPTCDRPADLRGCLASLTAQRTRHNLEIIVVDNRPSGEMARRVAAGFPSVRLVSEHRPGLSYARNTGITQATGSIVITTDDDVVAPDGWIEKLVQPFARPEVMAVTGQVLPIELETEAQCRFEAYGGLGKGFAPFEVDAAWLRAPRGAAPTWTIGATANAAFRASIFTDPAVGLLDEALGAGMPTGCSEDTYLFYRILNAGHTIVYQPSAYVWHRHRASMDSLRAQIYAYSKGHVAYHLTTWMKEGDRRAFVRLAYSLPKTYLCRAWERLRRHSDYPLSLIVIEILGNLAGPLALWRARRRVRRLGASERRSTERNDAVPLESQVS